MASVIQPQVHRLPVRAPLVELAGVTHRFPDAATPVFAGIDLTIRSGDFVAVVGGSGVGKSTLLRCVAGLVKQTAGRISFVSDPTPGRRRRAVVFQDGRLLPWRTLAGNIEFGLEGLGLTRRERHERVAEVLDLTLLKDFADRWPHQLSGGQLQRGGIARALAVQPDLLLMDEPFSAVDAITRQVLQDELLRIWQATGAAVLFVTHDINEAVLLADRVLVMGGEPATFTLDRAISLPRPRRRDDVELFRLAAEISTAIQINHKLD